MEGYLDVHTKAMNPEQVAYWFFRLNGCLTMVNFVVHPEWRGSQRTDVDIVAVRFPHRLEAVGPQKPLQDHRLFQDRKKVDLVIAEIKTGRCSLNGPWTARELGNLPLVLGAIGVFAQNQLASVVQCLYDESYYENSNFIIRLFSLGRQKNAGLAKNVVQVEWPEVANFFFDRFSAHGKYKTQHEQWDSCGQTLFKLWEEFKHCRDKFTITLFKQMGLNR
jgi:hypothetical protein